MESFPVTRSTKRARSQLQVAQESDEDSAISRNPLQVAQEINSIHTPAGETIATGDRLTEEQGKTSVAPLHENGIIRWTNVPRQPIPPLDVKLCVGNQLNHKRLPKEYKHMPPNGELMASLEGYPEGLLAIPNEDGSPRIIVPRSQVKSLVLQCHEDIHKQSHVNG